MKQTCVLTDWNPKIITLNIIKVSLEKKMWIILPIITILFLT